MKWFYNLKTSAKLFASFGLISILLAFVGLFGLNNLSKIADGMNGMYNNNLGAINSLSQAKNSYEQIRFNILYMNLMAKPDQKKQYDDNIQKLKKDIQDQKDKYSKANLSNEEQAQFKNFEYAWQMYNQFSDQDIKAG